MNVGKVCGVISQKHEKPYKKVRKGKAILLTRVEAPV
jgi:hypothetical protein